MIDVSCRTCGSALVIRRRYRMSPVIVAVGYCGLMISVIAICGSLIMVFFGIDRLRATFVQEMSAPQVGVMRVAGVPEAVIRKVAAAEIVTAAERAELTDRQVRLIADAQGRVETARAAAADAVASARLNSIVVAVVGAVTGVLSLLLVARGTVRMCESCRTHG
jgi:hypothetical protein